MFRLFAEECIYGKTYGTYIYIDTAHVLLVSVGLAQARPNLLMCLCLFLKWLPTSH